MLFYEPLFLFVFFPIVFSGFLAVRRNAGIRAWLLLGASVFFYFWSQPLFVPIVLATCIVDYVIAQQIARRAQYQRLFLAIGIIVNLGILSYFKYTNFAVDNFDLLLTHFHLPHVHIAAIALPIGVSFIVFEKITYLVDIAHGGSRPAPNFHTYLLYVFLFPKLLAGPIIKYHELESQLLSSGNFQSDGLIWRFRRFMLGVVKKTILADTLGAGADMTFNANPLLLGFTDAWLGVLFFTFQIYIDFSAYSDMAIGLAQMFGFRLKENFNMPYISCSITEFWRRWHISLTSWIREYLYIPLGGNRVPVWRCYFNLWICFFASGLWHGAAWHYVAWGAYNGVFLVLDRLFLLRGLNALPRIAANALTFLIIAAGWTIFRAKSLTQAGIFFHAMVHPGLTDHTAEVVRNTLMLAAAAAAALISFLPSAPGYEKFATAILASSKGRLMVQSVLLVLFTFALAKSLADPFKPFLYFRF